MKKIVLIIAVLAGLWIGIQYLRTGEFTLSPTPMSAEEQQIHDLEEQLDRVNAQIAQAGRSAGLTGMDTTSDVSALMEQKESLEKQIAEARKKLE